MSLLDELIAAGRRLPPSHLPNLADIGHIVGALAADLEHGEDFLNAAKDSTEAVAAVLGTAKPAPPADPTSPPDPSLPAAGPGPAGLPTPVSASPAPGDPSYAELLATVQSLQAAVGRSQAATVTSGPVPESEHDAELGSTEQLPTSLGASESVSGDPLHGEVDGPVPPESPA